MIQVAVMGYGTIGSGVVEVLETNKDKITEKTGKEIAVKYILDLREFPGDPHEAQIVHDFEIIEKDEDVEIVVEAMGGVNPAYKFAKACLLAGKHVVTSNKALVAAHGTELLAIAREKNLNFLFEASVGGGIPLLRPLTQSLAGEKIEEISGILNGTTNYILTKMAREGQTFEEALKKAQELGYAERNPEADVEGYDTCRKITILTSLATGKEVNYEDVPTEGITKITDTDFKYAAKLGTSIKLFGTSRMEGNKASVYVCPMIDRPDLFFTETTPLHTSSPYSSSKASADLFVLAYHRTYGLPVTVSRCSNNYGPYHFPEKLIPLMISRALADEELPVYGDGANVRDWLHVSDHCEAIDLILHKGRVGEIYNIGGHNERTNLEVVKTILKALDKPESLIRYVKDRPGHDRRYAIDPTKIETELGWKPKYNFDTGIRQTIDWYLNNQDWWKHILSGEYSQYFEKMYGDRL